MRYAIINEGLDTLAYFGDFQPTLRARRYSVAMKVPVIATNNSTPLRSTSLHSDPRPTRIRLTIAPATASRSSSSRVAPDATYDRSTPATNSRRPWASRSLRIFSRAKTY